MSPATRTCPQCLQPVGDRAPNATLCIKCALWNTRPKRWTLAQLEKLEASMDKTSWYAEQDVHLDCLRNFLHWLGEQDA